MRIEASTMLMTVTGTTFTNHAALEKGGVFYIETLKTLTLTSVTATTFTSPFSGGGGRFLYFSGATPFTLSMTGSSFTCSTTPYTAATV